MFTLKILRKKWGFPFFSMKRPSSLGADDRSGGPNPAFSGSGHLGGDTFGAV